MKWMQFEVLIKVHLTKSGGITELENAFIRISIMISSEMYNFQWIYLKLCVISLELLYLVNCSDFGKKYLSGF